LTDHGRALLVYRPGALGDALVALPALRVAQERFRATRTIFATAASVVPLLTENQVADLVISADDARLAPLLAGDVEKLTTAFGHIYAAVLWGGQTLSAAAAALRLHEVEVVHAPSRPADDGSLHVTRHLISTIKRGALAPKDAGSLSPPVRERDWLVEQYGSIVNRPFVAIHPGSGSRRKNWPPESFARVGQLLRERDALGLAIITGPADNGLAVEVLSALPEDPEIIAQNWPLGRVAALLSRADIYVGNDSGISHLAGCLGVPGAVLFGPTNPKVWTPNGGTLKALDQPTEGFGPAVISAALKMIRVRSQR
jgi:heptosyltransferase III